MSETELLLEVLASTQESVGVYEPDGTIVYINPRSEQVFGRSLAELRGRRLFEVFPDAVGNPFHAAFARVAAGGPAEELDHYYPPFDAWFANRLALIRGRVFVHARDITEDKRRQRRLETLARISEVLTTDELDMASTARRVSHIMTDVVDADCSIALLSPDQHWLEVVARSSRDPDLDALLGSVSRFSAHTGDPADALRTRSVVLAEPDPAAVRQLPIEDGALRDVLDRYAPSSVLVVPLFEGERALGVMTLSRGGSARALTQDDRALAAAVAPSVALFLALSERRAEATAARERLDVMSDTVPALIAVIDRDERYRYVNASYERWFGKRRDEIVGARVADFVPPVYPRIAEHIRKALAGEPVRFRTALDYPDGHRDVDAQYTPIVAASGEVDGFVVLVQDITHEVRIAELEAERAEAARRLNRKLESLLALTSRLAGASRFDDIASVLVDGGIEALDGALGALWTVDDEAGAMRMRREHGLLPEHAAAFHVVALDSPGPLSECVRTGRPVWISSRAEYAARYPELETLHRPSHAPPISFAILPLAIEGRVIGCINLSFHDERTLSSDERTYLEVLASHGAEALRRAGIHSELQDANETRAAMIEASPAAIMLLDEDGIVHAWNSAAERMFGWRAPDVIGRVLPAVGDRMDELRNHLREVLSGTPILGRETRRMRADGDWFDAEVYAAAAKLSDGRMRCLSVVVDISERKRIERGRQLVAETSAVLARSLELDRTLAELVELPVARGFADWSCVDLLAEDGTLSRVAWTDREPTDGSPTPRRIAHGTGYTGVSRAIATRRPQLQRDVDDAVLARVARDPQHLEWLRGLRIRSFLVVPLVLGERVLGALTLVAREHNFDESDAALAAEIASKAAIAIANARLFEEARAARRDAEAADRAKDEFLAMLGHELRNPLAPLVTALELMRSRAPDQLVRERAVIQRQAHHLARLVDDLLDISRITRGKLELRRERLELDALVAKAIEQTSPLLEQRRHEVAIQVEPLVVIDGDPTRLAQVIANLLSNAAKYTPPCGRIDVRGGIEDGRAVLRVRDTGQGIRAEMLPQIFGMFVQSPQTSDRREGGLGLGLAIVRNLVELHGGTVEARSDGPGRGAELTVRLPLATGAPARDESPARMRTGRRIAGRRILVVDDNEDAATLLADLLDRFGHEIRTALDGPSALRIADEFHPEVAVLDIGLPVMDGYELAARLRAHPGLTRLRLIALTGYGQDSDRSRALSGGFDAHLAKPVEIETLVKLLDDSG